MTQALATDRPDSSGVASAPDLRGHGTATRSGAGGASSAAPAVEECATDIAAYYPMEGGASGAAPGVVGATPLESGRSVASACVICAGGAFGWGGGSKSFRVRALEAPLRVEDIHYHGVRL